MLASQGAQSTRYKPRAKVAYVQLWGDQLSIVSQHSAGSFLQQWNRLCFHKTNFIKSYWLLVSCFHLFPLYLQTRVSIIALSFLPYLNHISLCFWIPWFTLPIFLQTPGLFISHLLTPDIFLENSTAILFDSDSPEWSCQFSFHSLGLQEHFQSISQRSSHLLLNILLLVHVSVPEWRHHHSCKFSQAFQWKKIIYV